MGVFACRDGDRLREAEAGFLVFVDVDAVREGLYHNFPQREDLVGATLSESIEDALPTPRPKLITAPNRLQRYGPGCVRL